MFQIKEICNNVFNSKTYILFKKGETKAWLVDIGDTEPIITFLKKQSLGVVGVLLTHGHFDHFYGLPSLMKHYPQFKIYATEYTKRVLASDEMNLSKPNKKSIIYEGDNIVLVKEGDKLELFEGEPTMHVCEVPGHNPGCMALVMGNVIFTGDAYIPGLGVKDFVPYADKVQAKQSMERLVLLSEGKRVYAGHKVD